MGVYSVNLGVPEGTDTEKVTDISVTAITEQTFHVDDQAVSSLSACRSVPQAERKVKRSRVDFKPGNLGTMLLCLFH